MMRIRPLCHLSNRHRLAQYTRISGGNKYRVFQGTSSEKRSDSSTPQAATADWPDFTDYKDSSQQQTAAGPTGFARFPHNHRGYAASTAAETSAADFFAAVRRTAGDTALIAGDTA